jgi:hypothetical protein
VLALERWRSKVRSLAHSTALIASGIAAAVCLHWPQRFHSGARARLLASNVQCLRADPRPRPQQVNAIYSPTDLLVGNSKMRRCVCFVEVSALRHTGSQSMTTSPRSKSVRRCSISCLVSSTLSSKSSPARHRQVLCSRRSTGLRHVLSSEREPQWHGLVLATTLSVDWRCDRRLIQQSRIGVVAHGEPMQPKRVGTISHSCFAITRSALHYHTVGPSFGSVVEECLTRNHVRSRDSCSSHASVPVPSLGMRHSFDEA